jgi:hypothetical protein
MTTAVRSYAVSYRHTPGESIVAATSPGRAKMQKWPDWQEVNPDARFTDLRVRVLDTLEQPSAFRRCMVYRQVPLARIGMRVEVGGMPGVIVGHNSSANLDVEFTGGPHAGQVLNCHPLWMIRYLDDSGATVYDFARPEAQPA